MVTTSQTPPQPFTLVIGDDPVYSLDTDRRRIGIGTRLPQRRLHLVTPDAVVARFESTGAASPQVEFRGSGGSGTLSYNSATGQWVLGTDLEATDSELAVDVLSVPDGGSESARIIVGTDGDLLIFHVGSNSYLRNKTGGLYLDNYNGSIQIRTGTGLSTAITVSASQLVTCSKGITVNTTAASSALVVADGTGVVSTVQNVVVGSDGGGNRSVIVRSSVASATLDLQAFGTFAQIISKQAPLQIDTAGSNDVVIQTNDTTAVTVSGSTQVATFAKGLIVPVVADATAESALTATAGALCFRTDTSKHRGYNGSAWVDLY